MNRFTLIRALFVTFVLLSLAAAADGQWHRAGLDGLAVTAIAVDPSNPATLYAGTSLSGLWKSVDGGTTWAASGAGYTGDIATAIVIDNSRPHIVYVGSNVGVFKSINAGASWNVKNAGLSDPRVQALVLEPANTDVLYVSVLGPGGGVHRSANAGEVWTPRALPVPSSGVAALAFRGGELWAGWTNVLFRTINGGSTWTQPFPDVLTSSIAAIAAPFGQNDVVVGLAQKGIYRGVASAGQWERAVDGLRTLRISAFAFVPADSRVIFAGGSGGGVFRSTNSGRTWASFSVGLANTDVAALAFDSLTGNRLYAATADGVFVLDRASCSSPTSLCLTGARFRVEVAWNSTMTGQSGVGTAVPISEDTGSFWFFNAANLELMIKILDARAINGRFWVFYGALSDVQYQITITDTATGAVKTYVNPQGQLASVADTSAF